MHSQFCTPFKLSTGLIGCLSVDMVVRNARIQGQVTVGIILNCRQSCPFPVQIAVFSVLGKKTGFLARPGKTSVSPQAISFAPSESKAPGYLEKCHTGQVEVVFAGYHISKIGFRPPEPKIHTITAFPKSTDSSQ